MALTASLPPKKVTPSVLRMRAALLLAKNKLSVQALRRKGVGYDRARREVDNIVKTLKTYSA